MKVSTYLALFSTAALAAAQFSFNSNNSTFTCENQGLVAYCAGGPIIVRCDNGVGVPGNCNDNIAGEPPVGIDGQAICYEPSKMSGTAACAKNGIVYPSSGSGAETDTTPFAMPMAQIAGGNNTRGAGDQPRFTNSTSPYSNSTVTTTSAAAAALNTGADTDPTYVTVTSANPASPAATSTSSPVRYTGAAASIIVPPTISTNSPYWAFAAFALLALF